MLGCGNSDGVHVLAFYFRAANCAWASVAALGIVLRIKQSVSVVPVLVPLAVPVVGSAWVVHVHICRTQVKAASAGSVRPSYKMYNFPLSEREARRHLLETKGLPANVTRRIQNAAITAKAAAAFIFHKVVVLVCHNHQSDADDQQESVFQLC